MRLSLLRRIAGTSIVGAIAGMIVYSIRNNIGAAMTAGTIGAIATLCLITGTAIHVDLIGHGSGDGLAAELEARVNDLINAGVDPQTARTTIRKAVRLGQSRVST
jgi:hypothetical protein